MDKNRSRVGGGIAFTYKKATIRVEEKYYNASGIFESYQTLAALEYKFGKVPFIIHYLGLVT